MTRPQADKYAEYVDHPRYGRRPNLTGLNPDPLRGEAHLHWNATSPRELSTLYSAAIGKRWTFLNIPSYKHPKRIANTAIVADLSRQTRSIVPVTHYFDLERECRDCKRPFIFFAAEQKHWYEELGFSLNSDCVRCVECRKTQQGILRQRAMYESLCHADNLTEDQALELADTCLSLIESKTFTVRKTEYVRMLLNSIPDDATVRAQSRFTDLVERVRSAETSC